MTHTDEISFEESLTLTDTLYIDVRSQGEFDDDHIPGAMNIPLFNNEERSEVGILYKVVGRDQAVIRGTEIVGKKLSGIVSDIMAHRNRTIVIYCARGGMRSGSVASLLTTLGIRSYRLDRGYKGYRNYVTRSLAELSVKPPLFILQGLTGVGKTEIIRLMDNTIDLEGMAGHRSSLFGGLGLDQRSQKRFESYIIKKISDLEKAPFVLIEGESRKIGNLHLPETLFHLMRQAPVILVEADIERRIDILLREYSDYLDDARILSIVTSLRTKLGSELVDKLVALYEGGDLRRFTKILLEKYYDPLYKHSIGKMSFIATVENNDSKTASLEISSIIEKHI